MYADDICIYAKNNCAKYAKIAVQRHLDEVESWSAKWRIKVSSEKTAAVVFSTKNKLKLQNLRLNGADIAYVSSHRYLGVDLQHRLNWRTHCDRIRTKALGALRTLGPLFRSGLPPTYQNSTI